MLKRTFSGVLSVLLVLLVQFPVRASVIESLQLIDGNILKVTGRIDLSGDWIAESSRDGKFNEFPPVVTLTVLNPGKSVGDLENSTAQQAKDMINYISARTAGSDGSYAFECKLYGDTGDYTAIVGGRFVPIAATQSFHYENTILTELNALKNSQDRNALKLFLEEEWGALHLDIYGYLKLRETGHEGLIIDSLMQADDFAGVRQVKAAFDVAVINAMFIMIDDAEVLYQYITDVFEAEHSIIGFLDTFCSRELRESLISGFLGKGFAGEEVFLKTLSDRTLVQYLKSIPYWGKVADVLSGDPFGFSEHDLKRYASLKDGNAVLKAVFEDAKNIQNAADARALFQAGVEKQAKAEASVTAPPSNSKRGAGGFALSPADIKAPQASGALADSAPDLFRDLSGFSWAEEAVYELYRANILSGVSEGVFAPESNMTREQLLQLCMKGLRLTGIGLTVEFEDVKESDWFYAAVAAAVDKKIIQGYGAGLFGTGENITRQDMAVILCRSAEAMGITMPAVNGTIFIDENDIAAYASKSIDALSAAGILNGFADGSFQPGGFLTRAEGAKAVYRFLQYCKAI